ncbi:MAG: DUF6502 family protein [Gammaproteobacteria bacterium]|nr:DUF6502 family protein [Gammaproteobacteria bacterium]
MIGDALKSDLQERLLDAVARCMRPIARMLLGAGISYAQFEEVVKRAFVAQALGEPDAKGRTTNISRVAVRTGLSRKEVSRVRQLLEAPIRKDDSTIQIGIPARALQLWHSDRIFLSESGLPIDLPFDDGEQSFSGLVKRVGGDVPAGAVRAELLSAGGMVELPNGKLRVQKRFFVPSALDEDLIVGFSFIVAPVLETLSHNLDDPSTAVIQRVAYSDHLPQGALAEFRKMSHVQAEGLMNSIDEWVSAHEDPSSATVDPTRRVGVGVFYFEGGGNSK